MKLLLLVLTALLLLSGCSSKKVSKPTYKAKKTTSNIATPKKKQTENWITVALLKEYSKWDGVPYKYGGSSLKGIDCSSLMQVLYKDAFGLKIPRTTKNQAKIGYPVKKNSSKEGDLVFFKTGWNTRHSGIIIEQGKFIHSSTKYGVMISNLNNPYWKNKYWQTRRVLP